MTLLQGVHEERLDSLHQRVDDPKVRTLPRKRDPENYGRTARVRGNCAKVTIVEAVGRGEGGAWGVEENGEPGLVLRHSSMTTWG